jgi:hypothetical protein
VKNFEIARQFDLMAGSWRSGVSTRSASVPIDARR